MITLIPRPFSALHSSSIFPVTMLPAMNWESANLSATLTLEWYGEAFIGSGRVNEAMAAMVVELDVAMNQAYTDSSVKEKVEQAEINRKQVQ